MRLSNYLKNKTFKDQKEIEIYIYDQIGDRIQDFSSPMMSIEDQIELPQVESKITDLRAL